MSKGTRSKNPGCIWENTNRLEIRDQVVYVIKLEGNQAVPEAQQ